MEWLTNPGHGSVEPDYVQHRLNYKILLPHFILFRGEENSKQSCSGKRICHVWIITDFTLSVPSLYLLLIFTFPQCYLQATFTRKKKWVVGWVEVKFWVGWHSYHQDNKIIECLHFSRSANCTLKNQLAWIYALWKRLAWMPC